MRKILIGWLAFALPLIVGLALWAIAWQGVSTSISAASTKTPSQAGVTNNQWPRTFDFATEVQKSANSAAFTGDWAGFGSVVPNREDGSVDVYWKGAPSPLFEAIRSRFASDVMVHMHAVANSFAELRGAAVQATNLTGAHEVEGVELTGAAVEPDCSGIVVGYAPGTTASLQKLRAKLERATGVEVHLSEEPRVTSAVAPAPAP